MRSALGTQTPAASPGAWVVAAPDLSRLPLEQLRAMRQAGREIAECHRVLRKSGLNIVGEVLRDSLSRGETFYEFNHYPDDDVYDCESHAQYYYHAHRSEAGKHGHFHCFLRPKGMPPGVAPISYPATDPWSQGEGALSHLVAIAMDGYGCPTGLFTTNRWVTAEAWYPAEQVIRMLDRFVIDHAFPSWPVNRWISAMFVLFRPHIEALLKKRDEAVWARAEAHPGTDVFEDRELGIASQMEISVKDTLRLAELALAQRQGGICSGVGDETSDRIGQAVSFYRGRSCPHPNLFCNPCSPARTAGTANWKPCPRMRASGSTNAASAMCC